jgi:CHAD domain-containing protein
VSLRLERFDDVAAELARLLLEQVDGAIAQIEGRGHADREKAVHEARKHLKKARAVLRLAREDLPKDVRRAENAVLRDAGRALSGARDADVLLRTLDGVAGDRRLGVPAAAARPLRQALEEHRERLAAGPGHVDEALESLRLLRGRAGDWPFAEAGPEAVLAALRTMQGRARETMAAAFAPDADDEAWHDWRKRVKDLWYALRILAPVAPTHLGPLVEDADALSEVLGDHNDLAVLDGAIDEHGGALDPVQAAALRVAVRARRDEQRVLAAPLGARLLAERPKPLARRVRALWDAQGLSAVAGALWLPAEVEAEVRAVLAERDATGDAAERRRLAARLRALGLRVADLGDDAPRGGLDTAAFEGLLARGRIRFGDPLAAVQDGLA